MPAQTRLILIGALTVAALNAAAAQEPTGSPTAGSPIIMLGAKKDVPWEVHVAVGRYKPRASPKDGIYGKEMPGAIELEFLQKCWVAAQDQDNHFVFLGKADGQKKTILEPYGWVPESLVFLHELQALTMEGTKISQKAVIVNIRETLQQRKEEFFLKLPRDFTEDFKGGKVTERVRERFSKRGVKLSTKAEILPHVDDAYLLIDEDEQFYRFEIHPSKDEFVVTDSMAMAAVEDSPVVSGYRLTEEALTTLKQRGLPNEIIEKLKPLDKLVLTQESFVKELEGLLGEDAKKFQEKVVQQAQLPAIRTAGFRLANTFFVYKFFPDKENATHALLGIKSAPALGDPYASIIKGWVQINRIKLWNSGEGARWNRFKLTKESLDALKARGAPDDVIEKLKSLEDRDFDTAESFSKALAATLDAESLKKIEKSASELAAPGSRDLGRCFETVESAKNWLKNPPGESITVAKEDPTIPYKPITSRILVFEGLEKVKDENGDEVPLLYNVAAPSGLASAKGAVDPNEIRSRLDLLQQNIKKLDIIFVIDDSQSMRRYFDAVGKVVDGVLKQAMDNRQIEDATTGKVSKTGTVTRLRVAVTYYSDKEAGKEVLPGFFRTIFDPTTSEDTALANLKEFIGEPPLVANKLPMLKLTDKRLTQLRGRLTEAEVQKLGALKDQGFDSRDTFLETVTAAIGKEKTAELYDSLMNHADNLGIRGHRFRYGGDDPEQMFEGIYQAVDAVRPELNESPLARRIMILIGDMGSHPLKDKDSKPLDEKAAIDELVEKLNPNPPVVESDKLGESPFEFYAIRVEDETVNPAKRHPVAIQMRSQMQTLCAALNEKEQKRLKLRSIVTANFFPSGKEEEKIKVIQVPELTDAITNKFKQIADEQLKRWGAIEQFRVGRWPSNPNKFEPTIVSSLGALGYTPEALAKLDALEIYLDGFVWRHAKSGTGRGKPQLQTEFRLSQGEISSIIGALDSLVGASRDELSNPTRLQGLYKSVVKEYAREDKVLSFETASRMHYGIPTRSKLLKKRPEELKDGLKPNSRDLLELRLTMERLKDLLAGYERPWRIQQNKDGDLEITTPKKDDAYRVKEVKFFTQSDVKYYWVPIEDLP